MYNIHRITKEELVEDERERERDERLERREERGERREERGKGKGKRDGPDHPHFRECELGFWLHLTSEWISGHHHDMNKGSPV